VAKGEGMTTMAEIEKAVDELVKAARDLEACQIIMSNNDCEGFYIKFDAFREAKRKLIQLIERLAQYQPREVMK
jgi:hypothetical protein